MNIKPLGNRLVVKLVKQKTTSNSGIILTTKNENEQAKGEIIAVGSGQGSEENIKDLGLKIGQIVVFGKYSGEEITNDANTQEIYKILNSKDILATLE
jgi:chaperonin GroES